MARNSFDLFMAVIILAALLALPVIVGVVVFRLYRRLKPFPQADNPTQSFMQLDNIQQDGYIRCSVVGWIICGPLYYLIYLLLT